MKTSLKPYLWAALAIVLSSWAALEFVLLVSRQLGYGAQGFLAGAVLGLCLGAFFTGLDGFFGQSPLRLERGLKFGALIGLCGGILGFYLIDQIAFHFEPFFTNPTIEALAYAQRWVVLSLALGAARGAAEQNNLAASRALIASLLAGISAAVLIGLVSGFLDRPFVLRGFSIFLFCFLFLGFHLRFLQYKREHWLRSLNGKHEGAEFELTRELYFLGTQSNDDINLDRYEEVNSTHAKLLKYEYGYALVDNDPFCRTFVNFRNITEQPLKKGDVIKIGSALFQYCTAA